MKLRVRRTKEEIQRILMKYPISGLTNTQFCNQFKLSESALYNWIKENKNQEHGGFIPVTIKSNIKEDKNLSAEIATHIDIKIELPTGLIVKIPMTADPKWLSAFIKELQ
jgi:hypothetical protein